MDRDAKKKNCRDLLKAAGLTVMVAALVTAFVIGTQQLGMQLLYR